MVRAVGILRVLVLLALVGCGGSDSTNGSPAGSKTVPSLADGELGTFCDDLAAIEGGYSKPRDLACDGGTASVSFGIGPDQTSCKMVFRALPASCSNLTVGQLTACVTDTYAVTCETIAAAVPSCDPFITCLAGAS